MTKVAGLTFAAFLALMTIGYGACAGLVDVTGTYEPLESGYRYDFSVQNLSDVQLNLHVAHFGVVLDGWPYTSIDHPSLWEYSAQRFNVIWETSEVPSGTWYEGIPPGQTLAGFNFTSPQMVTTMTYSVWLGNGTDSDGEQGEFTLTPVPEPASLLALGSGLVALGLPWMRRRVRGRE